MPIDVVRVTLVVPVYRERDDPPLAQDEALPLVLEAALELWPEEVVVEHGVDAGAIPPGLLESEPAGAPPRVTVGDVLRAECDPPVAVRTVEVCQ